MLLYMPIRMAMQNDDPSCRNLNVVLSAAFAYPADAGKYIINPLKQGTPEFCFVNVIAYESFVVMFPSSLPNNPVGFLPSDVLPFIQSLRLELNTSRGLESSSAAKNDLGLLRAVVMMYFSLPGSPAYSKTLT